RILLQAPRIEASVALGSKSTASACNERVRLAAPTRRMASATIASIVQAPSAPQPRGCEARTRSSSWLNASLFRRCEAIAAWRRCLPFCAGSHPSLVGCVDPATVTVQCDDVLVQPRALPAQRGAPGYERRLRASHGRRNLRQPWNLLRRARRRI